MASGASFNSVTPTLADYLDQAKSGKAVPVMRDIRADIETPVSAYWKLAHDQKYSFLLESVTGGENLARYSILGVKPKKIVRSKDSSISIESKGEIKQLPLEKGKDPLHTLEHELECLDPMPLPGAKHFFGGAVGLMAYDIVRYFEKLPNTCVDDLQVDDLAMMITDVVVVFDHVKNLIRIIASADGTESDYNRVCNEIEWVVQRLSEPLPPLPRNQLPTVKITPNQTQEKFEDAVTTIKKYIAAGDGVQMVPSLRFNIE
ncbi:MAG: anthranilate synthase component I, partial [Armatimonadota bacterium]